MRLLPVRGRSVAYDPPNRYETIHVELDPAQRAEHNPRTEFVSDSSKSVLSRNRSPDLSFDASVNPYRGCEHGCIYCYARPTHEQLGFSSGLDFERKIVVKHRAPELLRDAFLSTSWRPQVVCMSGVTDPYQPAERHFRLTRGCLKVFLEFRNPVSIITKNFLVTRDLDLLAEMAARDCAHVSISLTTLKNDLQRVMEPRTSVPARRLEAVRRLAEAGVPVGVNVAPVIPGLNDEEIPAILDAAAQAGAASAIFLLLRLPRGVDLLFERWLEERFPERKGKVMSRIREVRGGKLSDSAFHSRFRGQGTYAEQMLALFRVARKRAGLDRTLPPLSVAGFRRDGGQQMELFGRA